MSFDKLIFLFAISMPLVFLTIYWVVQTFLVPQTKSHFVTVCIVFPLLMLILAFAYTHVAAPTAEESVLIANGLMADPGPVSFGVLVLFGFVPVLVYMPVSMLLYWVIGRRGRK